VITPLGVILPNLSTLLGKPHVTIRARGDVAGKNSVSVSETPQNAGRGL